MLTNEELDLVRQWFDAVADLNPSYLDEADYALALKIYAVLGAKGPGPIRRAKRAAPGEMKA